tara:strand:- start:135 stop:383 length:249 start_codon:yes stop_codon:yes gene_type:complete
LRGKSKPRADLGEGFVYLRDAAGMLIRNAALQSIMELLASEVTDTSVAKRLLHIAIPGRGFASANGTIDVLLDRRIQFHCHA